MPTNPSDTNFALLREVAAGSREAFTELFRQHRDKVFNVALTITHSEAQAEELVQDVFLKLWVKKETLAEVENFDGFLFIVTRNYALKALKKIAFDRKVKVYLEENALPLLTAEDHLQVKYVRELVDQAVRALPPRQQQVYRLIKEKGLKREEVAKKLCISPNTIREHLAAASKSVRAYVSARLHLPIILWLLINFTKR